MNARRRFPLKLLDKYLISEIAAPFSFGVALFTAILLSGNFLFQLIEYVAQQGVPLSVVGKLFVYKLPSVVVLTFPMSMLLGSLLAMGRLSNDAEYTALMASGVGLARIAVAFVGFSVIVSLATLAMNEYLVPVGNSAAQRLKAEEIDRQKPQRDFLVKDEGRGTTRHIVYAERLDIQAGTMSGLTILRFEGARTEAVIKAKSATWEAAEDKWHLHDGSISPLTRPSGGGYIGEIPFGSAGYSIDIGKNPEDIVREQKKPRDMSARELKAQIRLLRKHGAETSLWATEYHDRYAVPFAATVFGLIGIPLGARRGRARGAGVGFGIAVATIFVYYVLWYSMRILGRGGSLPPSLAAWFANIVFFAAGLILLWRASK